MPKRSWTRDYCTIEDGFITCNLCDKRFRYKSATSTVMRHLKNVHLLNNDNDPESSNVPYNGKKRTLIFLTKSSNKSYSYIDLFLLYLHIYFNFLDDDVRKQNIDKLLMNLVTSDSQPFNIVEDKRFKALINFLDPRYNLPSKKTLKKLVKNRDNLKTHVRKRIKK